MFADIHFYFICWSVVWKMLEVVRLGTPIAALRAVYRKHRNVAEKYAAARDHLEHFDERLPGGRKRLRLHLGNLLGTTYHLGSETWDVSRASLTALDQLVKDYRDAIIASAPPRPVPRATTTEEATR